MVYMVRVYDTYTYGRNVRVLEYRVHGVRTRIRTNGIRTGIPGDHSWNVPWYHGSTSGTMVRTNWYTYVPR